MNTSGKMNNYTKIDVGIPPQSVASSAVTGAYYNMQDYRKILFTGNAGAVADGQTVVFQAMQATDGEGSDAKVITNVSATITSPVNVASAKVVGATVVAGNVITINGTTFTGSDTPTAADGEFDTSGTSNAAMTDLATVVNSLLPDLVASTTDDTMTLTVKDPGETTITITDETNTFTPSTLSAVAYVEVDESALDDGFTHVALKGTTDATIVIGASAERGGASYTPTQHVAASKDNVAA